MEETISLRELRERYAIHIFMSICYVVCIVNVNIATISKEAQALPHWGTR